MFSRITLRLWIKSNKPVIDYTGKISKTILARLAPWILEYYEPVRGVFKPFSLSPPIDAETGQSVFPRVTRRGLVAPVLGGEYLVHVGLPSDIARSLLGELDTKRGTRGSFPFKGVSIKYMLLDVVDTTPPPPRIRPGTTLEVRFIAPTILADPWLPRRNYHRYTPTPGNVFWIPYMLAHNKYTATPADTRIAIEYLEQTLRETWSTARNTKIVKIQYNGNHEPALIGTARYIILNTSPLKPLQQTIHTANTLGTGTSRATGFGTIEIKQVKQKQNQ